MLIEICCGEDSAIGRIRNGITNLLVIRVTQRHDFTLRSTADTIMSCVRNSRCHLWNSSPCTAGCQFNLPNGPNWNKGPDTQRVIDTHWKVHKHMWREWKRVAAHAQKRGASLTFEWAWTSSLHRMEHVQKFVTKNHMTKHKVSGCAFGLTSIATRTRGRPLCKAWGVWTNNESLNIALETRFVRCSGCKPKTAVEGLDTAHSGSYPDPLAKFLNKIITMPVDAVRSLAAALEERARSPGCTTSSPASAGKEKWQLCDPDIDHSPINFWDIDPHSVAHVAK